MERLFIIQLVVMLILKQTSEAQVLKDVRKLLSYLPQNNQEKPPVLHSDDNDDYRPDLTDVVPFEGIRPYDIRKVVEQVVDARFIYGSTS